MTSKTDDIIGFFLGDFQFVSRIELLSNNELGTSSAKERSFLVLVRNIFIRSENEWAKKGNDIVLARDSCCFRGASSELDPVTNLSGSDS